MQLQSYLDRIGYSGPIEPTLDCLRAVHRQQAMAVPYEDIDVQLGVPLTIDIDAIFDKIVTRRRGGWCYELNGILGWALAEIGFDVTRVAGGVLREMFGDWAITNHLVLLVKLDRTYLADLGLGDGIREPIPLEAGAYRQGALTFALEQVPDGYWRFRNHGFGFPPSFDFRAEPADEAALAARCAWLQTAAESRFVQNLIVQRMEPDAVLALTGRVLRRKTADRQDKTLLNSPAELAETLEREFAIRGVDVAKLWPKVAARHEELFGEKPIEQIVVAGM
ncbi:MAG TPA: arylamine N-acetyltransferase [Rhizobiaceae bacterium]|nr:arylamine N-acetyltransferase [Rhizobiaceae bacterium]